MCSENPVEIFDSYNQNISINFKKIYDNFIESVKKRNKRKEDYNVIEDSWSKNPEIGIKIKSSFDSKIFDQFYDLEYTGFEDKMVFKKALQQKKNLLRAEKFNSKDEQYYHVCNNQLGLKESSKKFNDCVYKIMTMELELAKINAEKEIAIAKAEAARANQQLAEEAAAKAIEEVNSEKFKKNISNLLLGLLVLGEINHASQQASSFMKTFTCTPTGFATGLTYSVSCY